jgi:hypothetical protein
VSRAAWHQSPTQAKQAALKLKINIANERKSHEARSPLSKPVALSQEHQTKSCHPNQTGGEVELRLPTGAFRFETTNQNP